MKDELQDRIDDVQKQLDERNKIVPPVVKPDTDLNGTSTNGGSNVNTSDITNITALFAIFTVLLFAIVVFDRKRKEQVE